MTRNDRSGTIVPMRTVWSLDDDAATEMLERGATVREVAAALGVSRQAVNHAIRRGRIPAPIHGGPRADRINEDGTPPQAACAGSPTPG